MDSLKVLMAIGYYSNTPAASYRKGVGLDSCKAKKKIPCLARYLSKSEAKPLLRKSA